MCWNNTWNLPCFSGLGALFACCPIYDVAGSPDIQEDIANACSRETVTAILEEIGDGYFAVLADKSRDVSCKQ